MNLANTTTQKNNKQKIVKLYEATILFSNKQLVMFFF